jgi:hypothetical protein
MKKTVTLSITLLALLLIMTCLVPRAWAGSGIITDSGKGKVLNLTVFFDDAAQYQDTVTQKEWKDTFTKAHAMLWTATGGLLRFGTIRMGTDKSLYERCDIKIETSGTAAVLAPTDRTTTSLGTGDTLYLFKEDRASPIVLLHELGHYLFCLSDEYRSNIYWNDGRLAEDKNDSLSFCCVEEAQTAEANPKHSCVMYRHKDSTAKIYYTFCGDEHLKKNILTGVNAGKYAVSDQERHYKKSCLAVMMAFLGVTTLPTAPTEEPPDTPTLLELKPEVRYSVLIQSNLSEAQLKIAKDEAERAVRMLRLPASPRGGDSVRVDTFAASVNNLTSWKELQSQADMDESVKVIQGIRTTTGSVDLEASLRAEMNSIAQTTHPYANKTICLYTNGPGKVSQALVDDLRRNDVAVNVVALDENANTEDLKAMTKKVGGIFTQKSSATGAGASLRRTAKARIDDSSEDEPTTAIGGYCIARYSTMLQPGTPFIQSLPVDQLNDEIIIDISSSPVSLLTLALTDPSGVIVDLDNPPDSVQVQKSNTLVQIRIEKPMPGDWRFEARGGSTMPLSLVLSGIGEPLAESEIEEGVTKFPQATELHVRVESGQIVTGCSVQAVVTEPDGTQVTEPLYDDGNLPLHGDMTADDGLYSALITQYPGSGTYRVEFRVVNENGQFSTAIPGGDPQPDDLPPGPTGPAPAFRRIVFDSFIVNGVPAQGGTALREPSNLALQSMSPGQVTLTWKDASTGRAHTVIQRAAGDSTVFQEITTIDAGQEVYTDLDAGTSGLVSYRLIARDSSGDSRPGESEYIDVGIAASSATTGDGGFIGAGGGSGSGRFCVIATAAYGSPMEPRVMLLRDFRDRWLLTNGPGRFCVRIYYALSPPLARIIAPSPLLRSGARLALAPLVISLSYPWMPLAIMSACLCAMLCWQVRRRRLVKVRLKAFPGEVKK